MHTRLRTQGLAMAAALLLVLGLAGTSLGATVLVGTDTVETEDPPAADTSLTWEDLDGDGIDDDCDAEVVPDPEAVAASDAAADTDGDGTISVDEAARTERIGGPDCNHGGYVDGVSAALGNDDEDTDEDEETDEEESEEEQPVEPCEADEIPPFDPVLFNGPGAFGAYVSSVAASDVVGGKNCNHGGAVSEAVKAARDAAQELRAAERAEAKAERAAARAAAAAERAAAKAERAAERAAAKAERAAARAAAKAEREAGQGGAGKGKGQNGG
jgi:hypothetical protein